MDGAGKYVRGDAIAGLIILAVNIVGGIIRGMMDGQQFMEALQYYATLTIGDGLVSQIPALVIATSAGILVTKSSSESNLGEEIARQMTSNHVAMYSGSAILGLIAFTPGFPKIPFFLIAIGVALFANAARKKHLERVKTPPPAPKVVDATPPEEKNLNQFLQSDRILIEFGPALIGMIEPKNGKSIAERIVNLRSEIAQQNGFWVPRARIRDNLQLPVHEYRIHVCGREVARGELRPHDYLAINPNQQPIDLPGETTTDPAFGMPAKWIPESSSHRAKLLGYTVVDVATVLITHLRECLRRHAHELLSREDMQKMLTKLRETSPTVVDEIKPEIVRPAVLHQVLVNLLMEQVPITALEAILEATVQHGVTVKDPSELTERVRGSIGHLIVDRFRDEQQRIRVVCLEPQVEFRLRELVDDGKIPLPPKPLQRLIEQIRKQWELGVMKNQPAAVIVDASIRKPLRRTIFRSIPEVAIIAYNEIPSSALIHPAGFIRTADVFEDDRSGPKSESGEALAGIAA
jgi:flagellar biosynthesis protein FlhA